MYCVSVSQLNNDIEVQPPTHTVLEQVVELSILLTGEMYSDDLKDSASLHHQTLSRLFAEKVRLWLQLLLSVSLYDSPQCYCILALRLGLTVSAGL